jgi:hypothetical protein
MFKGANAHADPHRLNWVDRYNTLGLDESVPLIDWYPAGGKRQVPQMLRLLNRADDLRHSQFLSSYRLRKFLRR